ncbi:MAG: class I SAM-dependent methyltransferase [Microthrixaceae bacterium]
MRNPRVECPLCGWSGPFFASSVKPFRRNRICPRCHSSERYRALAALLDGETTDRAGRFLEVAPTKLLPRWAASRWDQYVSLDLRSARAMVHADLCATPVVDGAFDTVVCFHVLEHIPDDGAAIAEMARVVAPGGRLIISVPFEAHRPATFEDPNVAPEDRERVFGQRDHVRIYGTDFADRLVRSGLDVSEVMWGDFVSRQTFDRYALAGDDDRFWVCRRPG